MTPTIEDVRQSALDLCSAVDDEDTVKQAQSFALASVVEALLYIGDQIGRVADALRQSRPSEEAEA